MSKFNEIAAKLHRKVDVELLSRVKIMNVQETLNYLMDKKCSISRYGDGEFKLMVDEQSLRFQPYSDELRNKLIDTMKNRPDDLLICVPHAFNNVYEYNDRAQQFWKNWRWFHLPEVVQKLREYCGSNYQFGNTLITRPYIDYRGSKNAEMVFPLLKKIWDGREILIVEGAETRLGIGNDLFDNAKSIKRILAPNKNAFSVYDKLITAVKENYSGELILLALGPTATVLAGDLCREGMQAIDVGHVDIEYEWFLSKTEDKIQIKGKYVNEVLVDSEIPECMDKKYVSEILAEVKAE